MSQVVVISGHPDLASSHTNTVILEELQNKVDNIEIRRLDTLYPDYQIDVEAEQAALLKADVIVLQFPFYWYSVPALMKKWLDDVLSYNFAYGSKGDKLKGKELITSFTIGGPEESYDPLGYNHFTIEQLILPLQQTAYLAGMRFNKPVYTHRMVYIPGVYNELEEVQDRAKQHAHRVADLVTELTESPAKIIEKFVTNWFKQLDGLPAETNSYEPHLAERFVMNMPEGTFKGVEGFRDWYGQARETFKPNCQHIVEQIEVKPNGDFFQVGLRVRLQAETFTHSTFEGQTINLLVNETWQVKLDAQSGVKLHHYVVEPVQG